MDPGITACGDTGQDSAVTLRKSEDAGGHWILRPSSGSLGGAAADLERRVELCHLEIVARQRSDERPHLGRVEDLKRHV